MKWILYSDGASRGNPGESGAGAFLRNEKGEEIELVKYLGSRTNNQAEYEGLILGLEKLVSLKAKKVEIRADSELMIRQLQGKYRVKNPDLQVLFTKAGALLKHFDEVALKHVPREQNLDADRLSNEAIDSHRKTW
ncbi:MAG: ribonuclease HI family protein [Deltaproteobacteria bacterium]|nr:ribonuclease HI family protein [Deltaproteobacteria bacterium]